jgi:hypothetical protein
MIQPIKLVSDNQRERTLKLLQAFKNIYGISLYLLMKKMLTVSILVDYYQELSHSHFYIHYEDFLVRNERIIKRREKISEVLTQNGCETNQTFFGFNAIEIHEKPLCEIIYMVKKRYKQ